MKPLFVTSVALSTITIAFAAIGPSWALRAAFVAASVWHLGTAVIATIKAGAS